MILRLLERFVSIFNFRFTFFAFVSNLLLSFRIFCFRFALQTEALSTIRPSPHVILRLLERFPSWTQRGLQLKRWV
jgi:hypothetical protein